jgi:sigma-E factor negative regulatory protein RseC
MQEIAEGFILQNEGDLVKVKVAPNADCDNCNTCSIPHIEILAFNPLNAKPGQKVKFTMPENSMLKISFMLFLFPLIAIFAGIYSGMLIAAKTGFNDAAVMTVCGILFFAVSVLCIFFYDKKYKLNKKNFPQIIEVIK